MLVEQILSDWEKLVKDWDKKYNKKRVDLRKFKH